MAVLTFTVSEPLEAQAVNVSCRLAGLTTFATAVLLELTSIVSDSPGSTLHCGVVIAVGELHPEADVVRWPLSETT